MIPCLMLRRPTFPKLHNLRLLELSSDNIFRRFLGNNILILVAFHVLVEANLRCVTTHMKL
jgi:hypothetical protein